MRKLPLVAALLAGLHATPAFADTAPTTGETMTDSAAIQETMERMIAGLQSGDVDGVLSTYEPEAVVVGEPGVPVSGPALREMFAGFIALNPTFTFPRHEILQSGDIALHLSSWQMEGTDPAGETIRQGGLSAVVLRRQPDGRWLMVLDNPFGSLVQEAP